MERGTQGALVTDTRACDLVVQGFPPPRAMAGTMTTVSYSAVRERLADLWDQIEDTREEVILRRRGHEELALMPASELRNLKKTVHLLRSPRNAARLLAALARSRGEAGVFEASDASCSD